MPAKRRLGYHIYLFFCFFILICWAGIAHAVEIPPTPTAHYYGDADGNVSINLSDIAQHNAYTSFRPCTYDTLQPQIGSQYWNTCDVDGNRSCNLSDIAILNSYSAFKTVSIGGDPWGLENINLPLSGNAPNTWIPFNINLYMTYSGAPSGRPGISVIAEIDPTSPSHGQLSGRSCTPVAGTRDQLSEPGAQCALAVTITDWQTGQEGLGLTESGTYGFQVWGDGDGDLKIDFHIEEWANMDVPLVTLLQTISFETVNQPPEWTSTAPTTATEDVLYTYDMTATDPESDPVTFLVNTATDTCGGSVVGSQYSFTPDETSGGFNCVVGVRVEEQYFLGGYDLTESWKVFVQGDYAYVASGTAGLQVINVSDPASPVYAGGYDTPSTSRGVYVSGNYAYIADWNSGLQIVDVSVPESPVWTGSYNTPGSARGVYVSGNYAFVADSLNGLEIIDVTAPGSPLFEGNYNTADLAVEVQVAGNYAYVADRYDGLIIIDVTDPSSPQLAGSYDTPGEAWDVFVSGNYAYVADKNFGLQIINITNPASPSPVGSYDTDGSTYDVYVVGDYAYLADGTGGIVVVDVSNPASPQFVLSYDAPGEAWGIFADANNAYLADNGSGLKIFSASQSLYADQNTTVDITEDNKLPTITVDCPSSAGENTATTCALSTSDGDLPLQALSCTLDVSTTCTGVTLTACTQADVPPQGEGSNPRTCDVVINVEDDFLPPGAGQGSDTITIDDENVAPEWNPEPSDIIICLNQPYSGVNGHAVDIDEPQQSLTCSKTSQTCSFNVTVSGSGTGEVDCQVDIPPVAAPEVCTVDVEVSDGFGGIAAKTINVKAGKAWYVDDTAVGANNGTSWTDAFNVIQDGVNAASAGEHVWVAEGTYVNESGIVTREVLVMKDGVEIYGGFAGTEGSIADRSDPRTYPTILDGQNASYHVVLGADDARLDGFKVVKGNANGQWDQSPALGGGMYNENVSVDIANCIFSENYSFNGGGGIFNKSCPSITITNAEISHNHADSDAGGISIRSSSTLIVNSTISDNACSYGAMLVSSSDSTLINCTISNNLSEYGVITISSSDVVIKNSIIWGNRLFEMEYYTTPPLITYSNIMGGYAGTGNIDADPMFLDSDYGNYRLDTGSPCRDAGDPDSALNDPDGTRNDMGAYGGPGTSAIDTDGDGMEDWWENLWGLNPLDPLDAMLDPDNDTLTNLEEFNYQFNPFVSELRYVDIDASGAGTGLNWADAFNHPQDALDAMNGAGIIWVAQGVYTKPYGATTYESVLEMKEGVQIYGGFNGTESNLAGRGDPADHPTILDGEKKSFHVVIGSNDARLDGFAVENGNAYCYCMGPCYPANCVPDTDGYGGGMLNENGSPVISNCIFKDNHAILAGGGIFNNFSNSTISDCIFKFNSSYFGAGIFSRNSISPLIDNSLFFSNFGGNGGAIASLSSWPVITNCTLSFNIAEHGGGIYTYNGQNTDRDIINCIIWGNNLGLPYQESQIFNEYEAPTVTYSNVQGGFTGEGNIGDLPEDEPLFVSVPEFFDRSAWFDSETTFWVNDPSKYLPGDVIQIHDDIRTVVSVSDYIVNFTPALPNPPQNAVVLNWGQNPTSTVLDLRLQAGSPCIDTGTTITGLDHDLDGNPRPSCSGFDMGAYEYQCP